MLGGPDDGKVFMLKQNQVRIGRIDPENQAAYSPEDDIVLSDGYTAVTRVSKPHGQFISSNEGLANRGLREHGRYQAQQ